MRGGIYNVRCRRVIVGIVLLLGVVSAESRFGRPVMKLASPKEFGYFALDDNRFPVLEKAQIAVTCMTYRGTKRYYVEVGLMNGTQSPVVLQRNFLTFQKPGYTVLLTDTLTSAVDVWASVAGGFVPTPPPPSTRATTTYSGTANTFGNMTHLNGTATTTVDNSAAGWHALGQAIAARSFYNAQSLNQTFAKYLVTFAHERQDMSLPPGEARQYVFTFEQIKQKKAPFTITVLAGGETFAFHYKE
jgi:hypothetical protein